jgi:hypothetical protein
MLPRVDFAGIRTLPFLVVRLRRVSPASRLYQAISDPLWDGSES